MIDQNTNRVLNEPKYFEISDSLRESITKGEYTDKLPSLREMIQTFNVNSKTLKKAITLLTEEGLVYSKHGSGTYITAPVTAPPALIGCLMRAQGHLFGDFTKDISLSLQRMGFLTAVVDTGDQSFSKVGPLNLNRLLSLQPHGLVVEGGNHQVMALLQQYEYRDRVRNLVLALNFSPDAPEWADQVVSDVYHGKYEATRHLIEKGRTRILYLEHNPPDKDTCANPDSTHSRGLSGYQKALEEAGLATDGYQNNEQSLYQKDNLRSLFDKYGIDGVVATNDACAVRFKNKLNELGLSVPNDVSIVGYFNTPWATMTETNLTSVSIQEADIAAAIAERITKDRTRGEIVMIKPKLVIRESS